MSRFLAIDPGPDQSGFVVWDTELPWKGPVEFGILPNPELIQRIADRTFGGAERLALEMVASYGMPVGKEVFNTCVVIGQFMACFGIAKSTLIYRREIKLHLCGTAKAKDANIRQALIDKYGQPGTKNNRGTLYGVKSHLWAAVALADYFASQLKERA